MKNKKILFIGKRLEAIKVALDAGYEVYVLSPPQPKKKISKSKKYFEIPYHGNFQALQHIQFDIILPLTEKAVRIAYEFCRSRGIKKPDLEKYVQCHNKYEMKKIALSKNISITQFQIVETAAEIQKCADQWEYPIVLKEIESSGSRGQIFIQNKKDIPENFKSKMLIEKWIEGREFSIESFLLNGKILFSNITEYHTHHHANVVPAPWPDELKEVILKENKKIVEAYEIQNGIAHVECFETAHGFVMGEVAVRPPGGYLMKLIEMAYGFSPWQTLIDLEAGTKPFLYTEPKAFAAAWIIHPGEGVVETEPDFLPLLSNPIVKDIKCGLKKGMMISRREGSGQDYGRVLLQSTDIQQIYDILEEIKKILNRSQGLIK
jgi:hypothetical protein